MRAQPEHWAPYYRGDETAQRLARQFSYSDRIRYYWLQPAVAAAVEQLFDNLRGSRCRKRSSRSGCRTCTQPAARAASRKSRARGCATGYAT